MSSEWMPLLLVALAPLAGVGLMIFLADRITSERARRKIMIWNHSVLGLIGAALAFSHGWQGRWGLGFWVAALMFLLASFMVVYELRIARHRSADSAR